MAKRTIIETESEIQDSESETPKWTPRGRTIKDKVPAGATRYLFDQAQQMSAPVNVYKEKVINTQSGKIDIKVWYTTTDGKTVWKDSVVRVNIQQQKETEIGFDYLQDYNEEVKKKLLAERIGKTKFYLKEGEDTQKIIDPEKDF